jgi:uncharacterized LabA/DUF88 family protein
MVAERSGLRSGLFVDAENIKRNGGRNLRFEALRQYACRDGTEAVRLNAYVAFDPEAARSRVGYRDGMLRYFSGWRGAGFKVIEKEVQWYEDEDGRRVSKANSDLDLAVDVLLQSARLDRVILVTGDGDFVQVVRAVQDMGCRVELIAFDNVSSRLRREVDFFLSGYLIPGLLPTEGIREAWGEVGSRVRGTCMFYNREKSFGLFRFLKEVHNLHVTDREEEGCPYGTAWFPAFKVKELVGVESLPSRDLIFEFDLIPGNKEGNVAADNVVLRYDYSARPKGQVEDPLNEGR